MKKLLVLTNSPHLYQGAGGRTRIVHELTEVLDNNVEARLFCLVDIKFYKNFKKLSEARKQLETDSGVKVVYFPRIPTIGGLLKYPANFLEAFTVGSYCIFWNCFNIHAQGISAAKPVVLLKKLIKKTRLLTDVHGVFPEEHFYDLGISDAREFERLSDIEKSIIQNSDLLFLVSHRMKDHYINKYQIKLENSLVVPCLTNIPINETRINEQKIPERLKDIGRDRLIFIYSGSYRKYQLIDETFDLFIKIKSQIPEAFFLILTNQVNVFEEKANALNLSVSDYKILSLTRNEVQEHLSYGDFGFLLRDDSIVNKVASPTKFAEYLLSGLPVITSQSVGDYSFIVNKEKLGFALDDILNPGKNLFDYISEFKSDKDHYKMSARKYALENLTWISHKPLIINTLRQYKFID